MASLTIWYGKAQPLRAVGVHQTRLLGFLEKHKGWHTMAQDRTTQRALEGLLRRKAVAYNPLTNQACIVYAQGEQA